MQGNHDIEGLDVLWTGHLNGPFCIRSESILRTGYQGLSLSEHAVDRTILWTKG